MKKINISTRQFDELQRLQMIRDISKNVWNELYLLADICDRKDKKRIYPFMDTIWDLSGSAVNKIFEIIKWREDDD